MKIKENFKHFDGKSAWDHIVSYISRTTTITTMTGLVISTRFVGNCIFLKGGSPGSKRAKRGEYLTAKDFIAAYDTVKNWDEINTGNVKPYIKRQQTPFIALLHCSGIIE